jgi:hypothetical protein
LDARRGGNGLAETFEHAFDGLSQKEYEKAILNFVRRPN